MEPFKRTLLHTLRSATKSAFSQTFTVTSSSRVTNAISIGRTQRRLLGPFLPKPLTTLRRYTTGPPAGPPAADAADEVDMPKPSYELTFTCKPCGERSTHTVSKQGYHKGTVLITCPSCKNRHVIADHLGIFLDRAMTLEQILREKGELFQKGSLNPNGDIEIWPESDVEESEIQSDSEKIIGKPSE